MKQHKILHLLLSVALMCCSLSAFAEQTFNIKNAQEELQNVNTYLTQYTLNTQTIKRIQAKTVELREEAQTCIKTETANLAEVDKLEAELKTLGAQQANFEQAQHYIQHKKDVTTERLFTCRLLSLQAADLHKTLQEKAESLAKSTTSFAGMPIYEAISGIFLTIGVCLIFTAIVYLGNIIFEQAKLHNLTILRNERSTEFIIFKFAFYALIAIWVILMLLEWWGVPINVLDRVKYGLVEGGTIYGVKIIPMRFLLGLIVFALIQITWKYTLFFISKKQKFDPEDDNHVVLTSILSYVVFTIALLIGLSISGVNFTGLAIVAGALTVGIGFGLQNIVNNFVSGIILLVEKTIRPGDRVLIKGYEGYVRKINLRYTRISTTSKDDVLIPNSDLISSPIINFEFEDKLANIKCFVGVAYGSDLDLVKQTLINVAISHPEVLHDPLHKPKVFINEFAESNIMFELECTITDVNRKHIISSDTYFKIAAAFKENNIEMSYPQRTIFIKQET